LEAARIAKGVVGKTDSEIEEKKLSKAFKDLPVNMNPDGLVEVDTIRQPCSMVFIGHVDAGKSTICGNLMYLNGIIDQRTIDKYK
jgi:peptide chain release factor subunit 3